MSKQFDVHINPSRYGREQRPFVIVVQHGNLSHLATRIAAPLVVIGAHQHHSRLNPVFSVEGRRVFFSPTEISNLPTRLLRNPIANLELERDRIIAALDLIFTGI